MQKETLLIGNDKNLQLLFLYGKKSTKEYKKKEQIVSNLPIEKTLIRIKEGR